jgi:hypothetical protein
MCWVPRPGDASRKTSLTVIWSWPLAWVLVLVWVWLPGDQEGEKFRFYLAPP